MSSFGGPAQGTRAADQARVNLESVEAGRRFDVIERLTPLAEARGLTLPQFALAWLLMNDAVTSLVWGLGLREHLEDSVKVDDIVPPSTCHGEWW